MKRFLRALRNFLPHLTIAMALGMAVLVYLDGRNPYMEFLTSGASKVYILLLCALCLAVAILDAARLRRGEDGKDGP